MWMTAENRRWWALTGACMGLFLLMLDSSVVVLAIPPIQHDLDASNSELQWIVNGYLLVLAVLVVTAGRLGDILGRRRVFLAGMLLFTAGSVLAALAPSPVVLIAARVIQGTGGSSMLGLSLAIVSHDFPPEERPRALGIWTAVSAMGLAVGPLVGGVLIDALGWRWIFWLCLPFAALGLTLTRIAAQESRDETAAHRIDVAGLVTLTVGLAGVVMALIEGKDWGWGAWQTVVLFGVGLLSLVAFWFVEHRVRSPLVEFSLFRNGPYFGASAAAFCLVGCYWGVDFFQPQYLQDVLGYSPLVSGILILPVTVPMILISPLAGRVVRRFGTRLVMTAGMACGTAGVLIQTQMTPDTGYALVLPGLLLLGVALGLVYAPMSAAAMAAMPAEKAGIAAGVLAMNRVLSGALILAVLGALFQHLQQDRLSSLLAGTASGLDPDRTELDSLLAGSPAARARLDSFDPGVVASIERVVDETFTYALARANWVMVVVMVVGTVLTWLYVRSPGEADAPEAVPTAAAAASPHHRLRFHL